MKQVRLVLGYYLVCESCKKLLALSIPEHQKHHYFIMSFKTVKVLIKWLNLPIPISLSFWDKWWFNMVSEPKVLSLNLGSVIYLPFQLNISRVGPHLLKGSPSPHVRGSVKVLIKWLNLLLPISLSFWNKWWFNKNGKRQIWIPI